MLKKLLSKCRFLDIRLEENLGQGMPRSSMVLGKIPLSLVIEQEYYLRLSESFSEYSRCFLSYFWSTDAGSFFHLH